MAKLVPYVKQQFFDSNGDPLVGGKIYTYQAGTSTPLDTYTDQGAGTPNSNPVVLDANGEASIWMVTTSSYKFVIKSSADVTLNTIDNVNAGLDNGEVTTAKIADSAVTTAKINDGAVTQAKLATKTVSTQALTNASVTSTTAAAYTGTLTFTATGRPVVVGLRGEKNGSAEAMFKISAPAGTEAVGVLEIFRDSTRLSTQKFGVKTSTISQAFTSTGTYTVPAGVTELWVEKACGGGGGGGSNGTSVNAAGGGSGSLVRWTRIPVTPADTLAVTIGAGGTAGDINGGDGAAGGDTYITTNNGSGSVIFRVKGGRGGKQNGDAVDGIGWGGDGGAGGDGGGSNAGSAGGNVKDNDVEAAGGAAGGQSGGTGGGGGGGGGAGSGAGGAGGAGRNADPGLAGSAGSNYGSGGGGAGGSGDSSRSAGGGAGAGGYLKLVGSPLTSGDTVEATLPPSAIRFVDTPSAGTPQYTVKAYVTTSGATLSMAGTISLEAYEL